MQPLVEREDISLDNGNAILMREESIIGRDYNGQVLKREVENKLREIWRVDTMGQHKITTMPVNDDRMRTWSTTLGEQDICANGVALTGNVPEAFGMISAPVF